jgi:hypothetical protein
VMKGIIQTSCSELLVDTGIYEPKDALKKLTQLFKDCQWESSPPLSLDMLEKLKESFDEDSGYDNHIEVLVYDKIGNRAWLEYGDNGYITTGYRFDSHCNQCDSLCFPIFKEAIERLNGEMTACDGGSKFHYDEWVGGKSETDSD